MLRTPLRTISQAGGQTRFQKQKWVPDKSSTHEDNSKKISPNYRLMQRRR
jgi:hypothetical protein